jgi:hypothetical protein
VEAIEAQINGDGAHFLFPSGADKGAALALLNRTTNASFPAKEFSQSRAKTSVKGEATQDTSAVPTAVEVKLYTSRSSSGAKVAAPVLSYAPAGSGGSTEPQIHYDLELDALAYIPLSQVNTAPSAYVTTTVGPPSFPTVHRRQR